MNKGKRSRKPVQDKARLLSKLEEVALREEVRGEFDVLGKRGVPLPKQPGRATPSEIDARTISQFKTLLPTDLLEILGEDEPPATGTRTARALGRMDAIVDRAQTHSGLTRDGIANYPTADQELRRQLIAALAGVKLRAGSRSKSKEAEAYLRTNHPRLWRDSWLKIRGSTRRGIMIESQQVRAQRRNK